MRHLLATAILTTACCMTTAGAQAADAGNATSDWLRVGGDQGGSRYSPLAQIDRKNVWRLERAWTWRHGEPDAFPGRRPFPGFNATPILLPDAAGGSLVLCTPGNRLVALDPATGKARWSFDPTIQVTQPPRHGAWRLTCPGVAYWQDPAAPAGQPCTHRILAGTNDRRLLAVDALSGEPCSRFGTDGQVDVKPLPAAPKPAPAAPWEVQFSAPPVVVNGVVVIGDTRTMDNRNGSAPVGALRAFNARTGEFRWSVDTPAHSTDAALSVDEERDLVFVPTAGDDRYANSVVALRGKTGAMAWGFQAGQHEARDRDAPAQPLLVDVPKDGHSVPAVVVLTRQALVFVLDRDTGKPLFPVQPPPLMKTRLTPDDAWGLTFWDQNRCRELIAGARHGDTFTPPGDTGRGSGAWDPGRNLLVTNLAQAGLDLPGPTQLPCTSPPWATLVGVDLAAGEIRWTVPLGTINRLASLPVPPLKWGTPVAGGPITTAGGLVFIGSTSDARLRAFDTDTGAELWSTPLPASAKASPMTYQRDGRQFIVIAAGGHTDINAQAIDDSLVAYALPGKYLESTR